MEPEQATPPKRLREGHKRCTQTQCGFYLNGGCKECEQCKARPYEINVECERCYACENMPNELRFGDKKVRESIKVPEKPELNGVLRDDGVLVIYGGRPVKLVRREEEVKM